MFIGLVGKSCSGKNYVGEILQGKGYEVLDLDKLCHKGLEDKDNVQAIVKAFGFDVLDESFISRKALGKIIFENPSKRETLERILYPWLIEEIKNRANANKSVIFLNGALLRRAGLDSYCSFIVYVDASYEDRLKRAISRDGITESGFEKREEAQKDVDFRENEYKAQILVINNNNETKKLELIRQINIICDRIETIFNKGNEGNEEK